MSPVVASWRVVLRLAARLTTPVGLTRSIGAEDRDSGTPDVKRVRVVTTVEYELRDD